MGRSRELEKRYLHIAAVVFLFIFLLSTVLLIVNLWENRDSARFPEGTAGPQSVLEYNGKEYGLKEGVRTLLVLGLDKFDEVEVDTGYTNDRQADFVMLLVIDDNDKTVTALHINRDTMADITVLGLAGEKIGMVNKQLALAHTYGNGKEVSCRNTAEAVSSLLYNITIDHYVSVTMDSVPAYNDLVGGVEITVLDDFTGIDEDLVKGETVTLMGDKALTYIRSRKGLDDSTNSTRMVRQRQYLNALYKKSVECKNSDENFVLNAVLKMADYMVSDCSTNQLTSLAQTIIDYKFTEIKTIEGDNVVGEQHMEFFPDVESLKKNVVELFYVPKN
ncbi:MAG: LCP family protein [Clostridia bacterium]|nr:LCP family protein [Clostridia bacterium]